MDLKYKLDLPREKLSSKGAAALSDVELLMAVIGSGGKDNDYRQIARNLDAAIQKKGINDLDYKDVRAIKGVGDAKAAIVFAAIEFARRKLIKSPAPLIDDAFKAAAELEFIRHKRQEHFVTLTLDGARRLINKHLITIGTLMSSLVHPREVFAPAIEDRAASIIIAHNHPSGMLDVSNQDKEVTRVIRQAGELLGIKLDDHIIIAGDCFVSAS